MSSFDADPDPKFHVDADPDPDPGPDCHQNDVDPHADPYPSLHMLEIRNNFVLFLVTASPIYNVYSFSSVSKCAIIFSIF